jgi:phosphoribosylanthranilate isomerase
MIGLNFAPKAEKSGRCITIEAAHTIAQSVPDRVVKVGVFLQNTIEEMIECIRLVPLDAIQVHDTLTINMVQDIQRECGPIGIIKALFQNNIATY